MRMRTAFAACLLAAAGVARAQTEAPVVTAAATEAAPAALAIVKVTLQTSLGPIVLAIEKDRAPLTAANFLRYVDQKRFDGCDFYRAMKIGDTGEFGLLQGGARSNPKRVLKPVAHEPTTQTGLSHVNGALSMARNEPGSATGDFFIVVGDLVSLDARAAAAGSDQPGDPGYAVFGRVLEGMDLVRAMLELPRTEDAANAVMKGQMLEKPVKILTARRAPAD